MGYNQDGRKPVSETCMRQTYKFKLKSQAQDKTEMKR